MLNIVKSTDVPVAPSLSFWRVVACLLPLSLCAAGRLAFAAETAAEAPAQIGNFLPRPSNTGKDWQPNGKTVYNLVANRNTAAFPVFGLDTEGGDRAKTNLLREPIRLVFTMADGKSLDTTSLAATAAFAPGRISYRIVPREGIQATWVVRRDRQNLAMDFRIEGPQAAQVNRVDLLIPFDPRVMGTTVLSEQWGEKGAVKAPLIVSALDMGQLRLSAAGPDPRLDCWFVGSRHYRRIDFRVEVLGPASRERSIVFAPVRLSKPNPSISNNEWVRVRRGLISLLHESAYMPTFEDNSGWFGSPGGIIGNNVISDPVSVNLDRNLQWLAGMKGKAKVGGIDLNVIARRTIEFWLRERMNEDGSIDYVLQKGNISADSNTGILNAATNYYLSKRDKEFVKRNRATMIKAADYLLKRDLDGDGLIETFRDGNGGNQFGDTAYDTIGSGWKNALVNGQAYKSLLGVSRMLADLGEKENSEKYRSRAIKLRVAYNKTFFDTQKRRYIWWIGQNGRRHDYNNPLIQSNAVQFGIADCLEQDAGIKLGPKDVMNALWESFERAEYFHTAKKKKVDYINPKTGDYRGFYWGIPNNMESVPADHIFSFYGDVTVNINFEFPHYCNGGIFPQDVVAAIMAFRRAGLGDKAKIIRQQSYRRQHQGFLTNGSGFYAGVGNSENAGYSITKWDGTPTDYEGIISRDCSFLQTTVLADDPARALFNSASKRSR